jgi:hypothetical protein
MKYLSLDIETTCLKPKIPTNVLMVSIVVEDTKNIKPLKELPHLTFFLSQIDDKYTGSSYALSLNSWILKIISKNIKKFEQPDNPWTAENHQVIVDKESGYLIFNYGFDNCLLEQTIKTFLESSFPDFPKTRVTLAGKNVAIFDYQFLPEWFQDCFKHRMIDPGSVFIDFNDDKDTIKGTEQLKKSLGLPYEVTHNAYEDALDIISILRKKYVKE